MNKRIKDRWIAALRSRKYKQCKGVLHDDNGYCCLGVLCDLHSKSKQGKEFGLKFEFKNGSYGIKYYYDNNVGILPEVVKEWAGLDDTDPILSEKLEKSASDLNDSGKKFHEIADFIERNL